MAIKLVHVKVHNYERSPIHFIDVLPAVTKFRQLLGQDKVL